jgi:hypothetical protein
MPFGSSCEYHDFAACVAANSGKDDPQGYCAELMRATEDSCRRRSMEPSRRYLNLDGFRELVRSIKDPKAVDTSTLVVVSALPTEVKAIGSDDSRLIEFIITTRPQGRRYEYTGGGERVADRSQGHR